MKHNGIAISDDAMIKNIEVTTASNPAMIEQEAENKVLYFPSNYFMHRFIVKEMLDDAKWQI